MSDPWLIAPCLAPDATRVERLRYSAARYGVELHTYGIGEVHSNWVETKVRMLKQYLEQNVPSDTAVLYVDGFDSVLLAGAQRILDCYDPDTFLLAAEIDLFPQEAEELLYPLSPTPWRYVNAGGWLAERSLALSVLEELEDYAADIENDQLIWHLAYVDNYLPVKLDYYCTVFQCLSGRQDMLNVNPKELRVYNELTRTYPCVLHGNGGSGKEWLRTLGG